MATRNTINARLSAFIISLLLGIAGCGGEDRGGAGSPSAIAQALADETVTENLVTGSVGDGPIAGARVIVRASSGAVLMESTSTATADYSFVIKTKGRNYPLTIEADDGIDLVTGGPPDFALLSAIMSPSSRAISNLNPFTTLIYATAQNAGGITSSNVSAAQSAVISRYGFGLDTALVPDPTASPISDTNVHVFIKTSETLGEVVRRTRDALYTAGSSRDGNAIVAALAADLTDGWIDGRGASGHDARLAAVANVASAAVLVQAMANRLHVYGTDSTRAMDNAILQIRPNAPASATVGNVRIPAAAFQQAIRALWSAQVLVDDPRIAATIEVMHTAVPGSTSATIASRLPSGIDTVLNQAVQLAGTATDAQLAEIGSIGRGNSPSNQGGTEPPPTSNGSPLISGSPDTSLVVSTPWSFTPTASDPDGDVLSFSVTNRPTWTQFDSKTGRLWGTPSQAGEYGPITITVSDGESSKSLKAFTLFASQPALGSATISWVPPTQNTDGTALTNLAGYKLYYGTSPGAMAYVTSITNAGQTSQMIENLSAATWYFAVTAYTKGGLESGKSTVVGKTIL